MQCVTAVGPGLSVYRRGCIVNCAVPCVPGPMDASLNLIGGLGECGSSLRLVPASHCGRGSDCQDHQGAFEWGPGPQPSPPPSRARNLHPHSGVVSSFWHSLHSQLPPSPTAYNATLPDSSYAGTWPCNAADMLVCRAPPRLPSHGHHRLLRSIRVRLLIAFPMGPLCCSLSSGGLGQSCAILGSGLYRWRRVFAQACTVASADSRDRFTSLAPCDPRHSSASRGLPSVSSCCLRSRHRSLRTHRPQGAFYDFSTTATPTLVDTGTIADEYCWGESFEMYQARMLRTSCCGFDSSNMVAPALSLSALGTVGAQMGPMRTEAGYHRSTTHDPQSTAHHPRFRSDLPQCMKRSSPNAASASAAATRTSASNLFA